MLAAVKYAIRLILRGWDLLRAATAVMNRFSGFSFSDAFRAARIGQRSIQWASDAAANPTSPISIFNPFGAGTSPAEIGAINGDPNAGIVDGSVVIVTPPTTLSWTQINAEFVTYYTETISRTGEISPDALRRLQQHGFTPLYILPNSFGGVR